MFAPQNSYNPHKWAYIPQLEYEKWVIFVNQHVNIVRTKNLIKMRTFWDPFVYFASLLMCVCLGNFYKRIKSTETKRSYGTGVGILVACLVCGPHILHTIFLVLGNTIIIRCCDRRFESYSLVDLILYLIAIYAVHFYKF